MAPPQHAPRLEIAVSQAAETIVALNLIASTDIRCDNYEIGCGWFDQTRSKLSEDLRPRLAPFQAAEATHALWHNLLAAVAEAPASLPDFLRHLEAMPTDELWLQFLGFHGRPDPSAELREAMLAAGRGSLEPLEAMLARDPTAGGGWLHGLARALGGDAEATRRTVADVLSRWHEEVFAEQWAEIAPVLERDAEEKRALARQRPFEDVVEESTNGGEYEPEAGIGRLLLVPTYLGRPWVIQSRQRGTLVVVYPVGEAALAASPEEAQRRRVLLLTKALSDDTRLRALRLMAGSSRSLQELADELGVRKSTMHHHIAVLRSAGLLRMRFFEKRYSLRTTPLAELSGLLTGYVGAGNRRPPQRRRG